MKGGAIVKKMTCPKCKAQMNCHAEKPSDPRTREEEAALATGTVIIEETYFCANCGDIESLRIA